jgi:hypothetical protein
VKRSDRTVLRRDDGRTEVVVDRWNPELSERAMAMGVEVESLSLEEIFVALCGPENGGAE